MAHQIPSAVSPYTLDIGDNEKIMFSAFHETVKLHVGWSQGFSF